MASVTGTGSHPYPNVRRSRSNAGTWEARHPVHGATKHLGTFATPELARIAVLTAQAEHLESKASAYRAEAQRLLSAPPVISGAEIASAADSSGECPVTPPRSDSRSHGSQGRRRDLASSTALAARADDHPREDDDMTTGGPNR